MLALQQEYGAIHQMEERLFVEMVREKYGYDFSALKPDFFNKVLKRYQREVKLKSLGALQSRLVETEKLLTPLVEKLFPISTEENTKAFYKTFTQGVIPQLRTYPRIRIWHLGCRAKGTTTSLVTHLRKAGLLDRTVIYGTDLTQELVDASHAPSTKKKTRANIKQNTKQKTGQVYLSYFPYNFLSDRSFNEFHAIVISTALLGLHPNAQEHVLALIDGSLSRWGFLGSFEKNLIEGSSLTGLYKPIGKNARHAGWLQRRM